jgi:hypothetical protein
MGRILTIMATRIAYYKDGKEVSRPKSLIFKGHTYVPPKDETLIAAGYEIREVEMPEPTPYIPTYEERVVELIRLRYDVNAELAILRQRDSKPEEFAEYDSYCEECKLQAKEEV